jgi:basic amino acid/polyamine antiporter, APA family
MDDTARSSEAQPLRVIGVVALSASILNMVVGAGIFSTPAAVGAQVGAAAPLAFVICAVTIGVVMVCFAMAGSRVPSTGGAYGYAGAAFGPFAAFQVGVLLCAAGGLTSAAIANALVGALAKYVPVVAHGGGRLGALATLYLVLAVVNIRGVKQGARLVGAMTIAKLVPLLVFVGAGLFFIQRNNIQWPGMPDHRALAQAVLILMFAFMGAESALTLSGEVKTPTRTVPLALLIGLGAVAILYMSIQLVAQGVLGSELANIRQNALAEAVRHFLGSGGVSLILVGFAVSSLGLISGDMLATPRALYAFGLDGLLPVTFARLHPRFRTPYAAIVAYALIVFAVAASSRFEELANRTVVIILLLYLVVCSAAWRLERQDRRDGLSSPLSFPGSKWLPLIALGVVTSLLATAAKADVAVALATVSITSVLYWLAKNAPWKVRSHHNRVTAELADGSP